MHISRRGLLAGAAVGGGLLVAWSFMPRSFDTPLAPGPGEVAFDAWLKIASDGVVTVAVPQLEMGQGVTTLLPQIVAMELGADWRQVAVEPAPVSGAYANIPLAAKWAPLWRPTIKELSDEVDDQLLVGWAQDERFTVTADGTALAAYEQPCREAGAAARAMLAMAAADEWGVDWEECEAANGFVTHGEKRASFADLVVAASDFEAPVPPPLRTSMPSEGRLDISGSGAAKRTAFARLDLPSKVDGSHIFAADVRIPGMVFAAIRHGPLDRAELLDFDASKAAGQRGLLQLVRGKRWLAAVAENWWAAEQALQRIAPRFAVENPVNSAGMAEALANGLRDGPGFVIEQRGAGIDGYQPTMSRKYEVAPGVHAGLETSSATARLSDDLLELWLPTQAPEMARKAAAKALGMSPSRVVLYPVAAGGSFDRRLDQQIAIEAALIAREVGRPVQLTWSRFEELTASWPRMPAAGLMAAELGPEGSIRTLRARLAAPPAAQEFGRRLFENSTSWSAIDAVEGEADRMAVEGLSPPYGIANCTVEHAPVRLALPSGRMRGQAHGITCFMRESFIDEVARSHEREPLSYRIAMLGQDVRLVQCLQGAARLAQWDGGAPGNGEGLACHRMDSGYAGGEEQGRIAVIAQASAGAGGVRVTRLAACVYIGRVVNRDIAMQQIEGGLIFGLGLALGCATEYDEGRPTHGRLAALGMPTLADCPEILVEIIESDAPPFDPGEIGVPAVAPAIANAYFSAVGRRLRRLPLVSPAT